MTKLTIARAEKEERIIGLGSKTFGCWRDYFCRIWRSNFVRCGNLGGFYILETDNFSMPSLHFKGKTAVETYHHSLPHHTLELNAQTSVLANNQQASLEDNLIIEGDNLIALKSLLPTHAEQIKCVFIDPPYNTGNEGWIYNDNLTQPQFKNWIGRVVGNDETDPTRHDKWCCMMYPRLQLLKELLRLDGVIFITIGYQEVHHLRLLMNDVFGEECYLAQIGWQKVYSPRMDAKDFSDTLDHILVYRRSKEFQIGKFAFEQNKKQFTGTDEATGKPYRPRNWRKEGSGSRRVDRPRLFYDLTAPDGTELWPIKPDGTEGRWRGERKRYQLLEQKGLIEWTEVEGQWQVYVKQIYDDEATQPPTTFWAHSEFGHNHEANEELKRIFGKLAFDNPKPVRLIKRILQLATDPDAIILDSFAGSGTTAQAVLEINEEDEESDRQFILIQQRYDTKEDEETKTNICKDITAERVHRIIEGYEYKGTSSELLLEQKLTLSTLRKADALLKRIETLRENKEERFNEIRAEMKDGVVRVEGIKKITEKTDGVGGTFTYARVSEKPLLGEYRDLDPLPPYEEIAKYIFFTETSKQCEVAGVDKRVGKIGESKGTSYYLLYTPNHEEDGSLDITFLKDVAAFDINKKLVVYCEKFWLHREELRQWEFENGKSVRHMLVPFNLK